ncbi:hypothetical protein FRB98_007751 [Tulasnella sp. 332]|nr:hypothetical protein FRB98_007751 [Tulasnella sp. 332]
MDIAEFHAEVYRYVALIPYGKVTSYGHIAKLIGMPSHSRHVGQALKFLAPDAGVPWQRVISSAGTISSRGPGTNGAARQRVALEAEGVEVTNGRTGEFRLYYAASSFGSQNSAIFFAKSSTGKPGSWTNEGLVTSTSTGATYNAIDPHLIIDGGNWWLSLGSFWSGIKLIALGSSTGKPSASTIYSLATRTADSGAIEASIVYKYGSYYYLFTSWDDCCEGISSTYNIRVGRSTSISGGYVDQSGVALTAGGGTLILATHDAIYGPGGQSVYTDVDAPVLVYHYYTTTTSNLAINLLDFSSGWPVVY